MLSVKFQFATFILFAGMITSQLNGMELTQDEDNQSDRVIRIQDYYGSIFEVKES